MICGNGVERMQQNDVKKQLAEAQELLLLIEHLVDSYARTGAKAAHSNGTVVPWQAIKFNVRECSKRLQAAKQRLSGEDRADGTFVTPKSKAPHETHERLRDLDFMDDFAVETAAGVRTSNGSAAAVRDGGLLAGRITKAPTRKGSIRELRSLDESNGVQKELIG